MFDIFGFADRVEKTFGLENNPILKFDSVDIVNFRDIAVANAKTVVFYVSWFFEKITPNLENQQRVADQMLPEIPTGLFYEERTVFRKRKLGILGKETLWHFDQE